MVGGECDLLRNGHHTFGGRLARVLLLKTACGSLKIFLRVLQFVDERVFRNVLVAVFFLSSWGLLSGPNLCEGIFGGVGLAFVFGQVCEHAGGVRAVEALDDREGHVHAC